MALGGWTNGANGAVSSWQGEAVWLFSDVRLPDMVHRATVLTLPPETVALWNTSINLLMYLGDIESKGLL